MSRPELRYPQSAAQAVQAEDQTISGELVAKRFLDALRKQLDAPWYVDYYHVPVADEEKLFDVALAHYLKVGAQFLFSPNRSFDEVEYRLQNADVEQEIARGGLLISGFQHYVLLGRQEGRRVAPIREVSRWQATHPMYSDAARRIRAYFDPRWYAARHAEVGELIARGTTPSPFMHYLTEGMAAGYSPNDWFDETWYLTAYPDVAEAKAKGAVPSGFFHYLASGREEGRLPKADTARELEVKYPGLTNPVGIEQLRAFETKLAPIKASISQKGPRRLNVLVPTLDKNIMFGGYIALLQFMAAMRDRGWAIRILILEDAAANPALSRLQFANNPLVSGLLDAAEIVNLTGSDRILEVTKADRFLAYSMWMAHHAHRLAELTGRRFLFFIQEYEPIFHAHDSWRALGASAYLKPHYAIFNSEILRSYFREGGHGVYADSAKKGDATSIAFEHALSVSGTPGPEELQRDGTKRLLFYARPESHAARNLFEIGMLALRRAVAAGAFGPEWEFDGVGTLGAEASIDLGSGRHLRLRPKLELADYGKALRGYDLGLSLMYAPHPSVVPFEMAASGMLVVTNVYSNRNADRLRGISGNIVPSELSIEGLAAALAVGAARTSDIESRISGAARPWVVDWKTSFSTKILNAVEKELK